MKPNTQRATAILVGLGLFLVMVIAMVGFNRIDEYEVGVKKNPVTGAVSSTPYRQGLYHAVIRSWTNYSLREVQYPPEGRSERLQALTSDQLTIGIDAAFRYKLNPDSVVQLYLNVGAPSDIHSFVYNTYRSAARDAVAEVNATDILSQQRMGMGDRIRGIMDQKLRPRGIQVTEFFVRDIEPPEALRLAIEAKLAREQQVQAESYQTEVVVEQANQKRAEAEGIRDAQDIIAASLTGISGQRYLYWRYLEVLGEIGRGTNNMVIAPTEGGIPLFFTPGQ